MGNFSYISKNYEEAVTNPWHTETLCELQLVVDGKVVEKMRGIYTGYGAVDHEKPFVHSVLREDGVWENITDVTQDRMMMVDFDGDMWVSKPWDEIVDLHCESSVHNGIAAWHLDSMDSVVPDATTRSDDDENQGDVFYGNREEEFDEGLDEEDRW